MATIVTESDEVNFEGITQDRLVLDLKFYINEEKQFRYTTYKYR